MNKETKPKAEMVPVSNGESKKVALTADFGTIYIRVSGNQILKPIKADMALYERLGHIYKLRDRFNITATGYRHLNKVASISLVTPQRVIVDGVAQPNPYIERNPRTKAIETVNIRKMGIGYSPAGNVVVIDKTLFYNVYTYFIQSIQAKMKRTRQSEGKRPDVGASECALYGVENKKPERPGSWAFFPTEPPLGVWVNYEDPAIIDCLEEHTQRQRFGDRIATTIIERNILKDHPAIGVAQVFEKQHEKLGAYAYVTVYGYRHEMEPRNIAEIMRQIEQGTDTYGEIDETASVEVKAETISQADTEEEKAAMQEVAVERSEDEAAEQSLFSQKKGKK